MMTNMMATFRLSPLLIHLQLQGEKKHGYNCFCPVQSFGKNFLALHDFQLISVPRMFTAVGFIGADANKTVSDQLTIV